MNVGDILYCHTSYYTKSAIGLKKLTLNEEYKITQYYLYKNTDNYLNYTFIKVECDFKDEVIEFINEDYKKYLWSRQDLRKEKLKKIQNSNL